MGRFVAGADRSQASLLPTGIDAFVTALDPTAPAMIRVGRLARAS